MSTRSRNNDPLYDAIEMTTIRIGRFGYGLLRLPLGLLPSQSRTHMERALYELSHGFASLPGDFARIAEQEIKRWIDETPPARSRQPEPEQHLTVMITPEEAVVEPAPSQHLAGTIAPAEARTETAAPAPSRRAVAAND